MTYLRLLKKHFWLSLLAHIMIVLLMVFGVFSLPGIKTSKKIALNAYVADNPQPTHASFENKKLIENLGPVPLAHSEIGQKDKRDIEKKISRSHNSSKESLETTSQKVKITPLILKLLHAAISAEQAYPEMAATLNQKGTVKIGFFFHPDGRLTNVSILKSSGFERIDSAALNAVNAISPLKQAGSYLRKSEFFTVDVVFE